MVQCRKCKKHLSEDNYFKASKDGRKWLDKICKTCKKLKSNARRLKHKKILVELKGGKCVRCGYKKSLRALQFHHVDPSEKDPVFQRITDVSLDRSTEELKKCILVCSNCHAEIHEELDSAECGCG